MLDIFRILLFRILQTHDGEISADVDITLDSRGVPSILHLGERPGPGSQLEIIHRCLTLNRRFRI